MMPYLRDSMRIRYEINYILQDNDIKCYAWFHLFHPPLLSIQKKLEERSNNKESSKVNIAPVMSGAAGYVTLFTTSL